MLLPLPFALLALAIAATWCPALSVGRLRIAPWTLLFGAAVAAGIAQGVLAALVALALSLHLTRGFDNPTAFSDLRLTPDAIAFTQYLSFDKGAAGLVLLAAFGARSTSPRRFAGQLATIVVAALATAALAIGIALAAGYVRFEPKLPAATLAFLLPNLFFTCVAEEAFFRGLIQERLMRRSGAAGGLVRTGLAVAVSTLLFGLAHAGGGTTWMLVATVAGLGYALTYAKTRTMEGPILVHFAVNAAHFLLFTYPTLAR